MSAELNEWMKSKGYPVGYQVKTAGEWNAIQKAFLQESGGGFKPTAIAVTNPVNTNQVIPVLTTSPNSVQPLPQPRLQYKPDKEGNLMAIDGTTANYVTNTTGERVKVDPKSNRLDDLMTVLGDNGARPEESGGGLGSWLASWMPGAGKPVPAATPAPSPAIQQTAEPAVPAGTNAAAPVALTTPEAIRAAFQAGQISEADAVRMLRGGR